jgi:DnaK suppressor protein
MYAVDYPDASYWITYHFIYKNSLRGSKLRLECRVYFNSRVEDKKMPKAKKSAKKAAKKSLKSAVKNVVSKLTKKSAAKKKATPKTKTAQKTAKTKTVAKKKTSPAKKAAKKATKKDSKTATKAVTKNKTAVKTAKKASKPKSDTKKPKKVNKKQETSMTQTKITTKIESAKKESAPKPTIKEDKQLDTTLDEVDVAPFEVETQEDNYMLDDQLEHFRKVLIRWKHQLMSEVDSTMGHMQEDGLSFPDPIDRAAQEEGFNLELRTRDRERKLIKKIESALDMIETRDYGYCEDCGAEIGVRRLEARPTATKCIDCKTYSEIREKQSGG